MRRSDMDQIEVMLDEDPAEAVALPGGCRQEGRGEPRSTPGQSSIEALCEDPEVDAVWIATPTTLHCPHSVLAAEHGKHFSV